MHAVQQPVFMAKHRRRPNDSCVREHFLDQLLALILRLIKLRRGIWRCIEVGDLNEARHTAVCSNFRNRGGSFGMHSVEVEVPAEEGISLHPGRRVICLDLLCFEVASNKIVDDVRMSQTLCDLLLVPNIPFLYKSSTCVQPHKDERLTRGIIWPKSPITLRWRLVSSSL